MYSLPSSLSSKRVMALPAGATGALKSMLTTFSASPVRSAVAGRVMWPFSMAAGAAIRFRRGLFLVIAVDFHEAKTVEHPSTFRRPKAGPAPSWRPDGGKHKKEGVGHC